MPQQRDGFAFTQQPEGGDGPMSALFRPAKPLTAGALQLLAPHQVNAPLLSWLIRLPLLSVEELARCQGTPVPTTYGQLSRQERLHLVEYITLSEEATPRWHRPRRYYVSDVGLYAYAQRARPPEHPSWLEHGYPVGERDLLKRLARPASLITLTDMASRLVSEGRQLGYRILDWQQPWQRYFLDARGRHRMTADAVARLATPGGGQQDLFVLIDSASAPHQHRQHRLHSLLAACEALWWQEGGDRYLPCALIVAEPSSLLTWAALVRSVIEKRTALLPPGGLATPPQLREGLFTPIWWSLLDAAQVDTGALETLEVEPPSHTCVALPALFTPRPADAPDARERVVVQGGLGRRRPRTELDIRALAKERWLPRIVRGQFAEQAAHLEAAHLWAERAPSSDEALRNAALLNLSLSSREKAMVHWLARHPLLSLPELATTLGCELDYTRRRLATLLRLSLARTSSWPGGATALDRERYRLSASALRWLAVRNGLVATHYLERRDGHILNEQQNVAGLEAQMDHTCGVYRTVTSIMRSARLSGDAGVLRWKNAHEAVRTFRDPDSGSNVPIQPDAEILYSWADGSRLLFLLEYDRDTMELRDYRYKFWNYQQYWCQTGIQPPLIFMVVQSQETASSIRDIVEETARAARWMPLPVRIETEESVLAEGFRRATPDR